MWTGRSKGKYLFAVTDGNICHACGHSRSRMKVIISVAEVSKESAVFKAKQQGLVAVDCSIA